ncbi:hypothetical protein C0585_00375 [Candidatus Woesearchaeota archaeon]|nr:MAG: hypothetical protein C0585_00375 [Candidatus Woesearchaeota archaeon]
MMMKTSILKKVPKPFFLSFIFLYFLLIINPPQEVLLSFDTESDVGDEKAVQKIIDVLDRYNATATFFVMGTFVEQNPDLIRILYSKGHEIACHTNTHKNLFLISEVEQEEEIRSCKESIEKLGISIEGFRAPWRLLTLDSAKILKENNFLYDASLFDIQPNIFSIKEVYTSTSFGIIPADDYIQLLFLKLNKKLYFQGLKNIYDKKVSMSFHPHIIMVYETGFEELIKYYNQKHVKFITHKKSLE